VPEEGKESSVFAALKKALKKGRKAFFPNGLQPWARQELRWQNVPDLASAIIAAERMVDDMEKPTHSHKQRGNFFEATRRVEWRAKERGRTCYQRAGNKPGKPNKGLGLFHLWRPSKSP